MKKLLVVLSFISVISIGVYIVLMDNTKIEAAESQNIVTQVNTITDNHTEDNGGKVEEDLSEGQPISETQEPEISNNIVEDVNKEVVEVENTIDTYMDASHTKTDSVPEVYNKFGELINQGYIDNVYGYDYSTLEGFNDGSIYTKEYAETYYDYMDLHEDMAHGWFEEYGDKGHVVFYEYKDTNYNSGGLYSDADDYEANNWYDYSEPNTYTYNNYESKKNDLFALNIGDRVTYNGVIMGTVIAKAEFNKYTVAWDSKYKTNNPGKSKLDSLNNHGIRLGGVSDVLDLHLIKDTGIW
jgi:hypothetical protein